MPEGLSPWLWVGLAIAPAFPLLGLLVGEITPPDLGERTRQDRRYSPGILVLWTAWIMTGLIGIGTLIILETRR